MKRKIYSIALLLGICLSASAHLIHFTIIKNGGPRGYKKTTNYEGLLLSIHSCKDPGVINCPFDARIIGGGDSTLQGPLVLSEAAFQVAPGLPAYAQEFIKTQQAETFKSGEKKGTISSTFLVNGELVVLTAKFRRKDDNSFEFKVASNATFAQNIAELEASETDEANN